MRAKGLEPPRLAALDPKSSASTSFATPASFKRCKDTAFLLTTKQSPEFLHLQVPCAEPNYTLLNSNFAPLTIIPQTYSCLRLTLSLPSQCHPTKMESRRHTSRHPRPSKASGFHPARQSCERNPLYFLKRKSPAPSFPENPHSTPIG